MSDLKSPYFFLIILLILIVLAVCPALIWLRRRLAITALHKAAMQGDSEAFDQIQKAAQQNFALAQVALGSMYDYGRGVPQNYTKAIEWYEKAANQGIADVQYRLGKMYAEGLCDETLSVLQTETKARDWLQKAAAQGHKAAADDLAEMTERLRKLKGAVGIGQPIRIESEQEWARRQLKDTFGYQPNLRNRK